MSRGKVVLRTGPVVAMVIKVVSRGLVFAFGVVGFLLVLKLSVVSIFGVVGKCFCVENDMPVLVLKYVLVFLVYILLLKTKQQHLHPKYKSIFLHF